MKLSATAAGVIPLLSGEVAADSQEYDTVTVPEGGSKQFVISDGETLENLIIDITADNADAQIVADGDNWTIRNVGFRGSTDVGNFEGGFSNLIKPRGNGVIEQCYLGDGVSRDEMRKGAIGPPSSHAGTIYIRNCYIAEWPDNGVYSAHTAQNGGGTVHIDGCYFRDNNVAHMRVASDGTVVENTVAHNTGNIPELPGGTVHSKGIYTGYGDPDQVVEVRNCHFDQRDEIADGPDSAAAFVSTDHSSNGPCSTVRVSDTEYLGDVTGDYVDLATGNGNDPDTAVPAGVPTDATEAASGEQQPEDGSSPTIDRYEVTESDSPNPHANITAEWDVSDADGDLATGLVEVIGSDGTVVDTSETDISGDVHYGVDYFEIKNADGESFEVRVTVTDAEGNQATASQTVTE